MHFYEDLIRLFNACFASEYQTQLVKGWDEPIYIPKGYTSASLPVQNYHAIYFAYGYFSSALHECAHWFIAGEARRQLVDFGYWYAPDGRTAKQQELFLSVEVKPQAIEWILSQAAQYKFQCSFDNLNGEAIDSQLFKMAVFNQVQEYCSKGLPKRAAMFRRALCEFYGTSYDLNCQSFEVNCL